jgi:hypothetical protein
VLRGRESRIAVPPAIASTIQVKLSAPSLIPKTSGTASSTSSVGSSRERCYPTTPRHRDSSRDIAVSDGKSILRRFGESLTWPKFSEDEFFSYNSIRLRASLRWQVNRYLQTAGRRNWRAWSQIPPATMCGLDYEQVKIPCTRREPAALVTKCTFARLLTADRSCAIGDRCSVGSYIRLELFVLVSVAVPKPNGGHWRAQAFDLVPRNRPSSC